MFTGVVLRYLRNLGIPKMAVGHQYAIKKTFVSSGGDDIPACRTDTIFAVRVYRVYG